MALSTKSVTLTNELAFKHLPEEVSRADDTSVLGSISQFMWDTAVLRISQLASEMHVSIGGQSVGASNGNADELTIWDGIKKRGLGI